MGKRAIGHIRSDPTLPCKFCLSTVDDNILYGSMYTIGNITCHYFCVLLSTKLIQKGRDSEGILGFLYRDIRNELEWAKNKRCSYCNLTGATIFCCHRSCRLMFHLPCGLENGALPQYHRTFQTFCSRHRVNQTIPRDILSTCTKMVVSLYKIKFQQNYTQNDIENIMLKSSANSQTHSNLHPHVCFICYEEIIFSENMNDKFWPPCCKTNSLLHKRCLSRMALSAGKYYIRCPFCNNSNEFVGALLAFGIYIPEQDASWERENGAFNDLLHRPSQCIADVCKCPKGRSGEVSKRWNLLICDTCGSEAVHKECIDVDTYECHRCIKTCTPIESSPTEEFLFNQTPEKLHNILKNRDSDDISHIKISDIDSGNKNKSSLQIKLNSEYSDMDCSYSSSSGFENNLDFKCDIEKEKNLFSIDEGLIGIQNKPSLDSTVDEQITSHTDTYLSGSDALPLKNNLKTDSVQQISDSTEVNHNESQSISINNNLKRPEKMDIIYNTKNDSDENNYCGKGSIINYFTILKTNSKDRSQSAEPNLPSKKSSQSEIPSFSGTLDKYFYTKDMKSLRQSNCENRKIIKKKSVTKTKNNSVTTYSIKNYFVTNDAKPNVRKSKRNYLKRLKKITYSVEFSERNADGNIESVSSSVSVSRDYLNNTEFKKFRRETKKCQQM